MQLSNFHRKSHDRRIMWLSKCKIRLAWCDQSSRMISLRSLWITKSLQVDALNFNLAWSKSKPSMIGLGISQSCIRWLARQINFRRTNPEVMTSHLIKYWTNQSWIALSLSRRRCCQPRYLGVTQFQWLSNLRGSVKNSRKLNLRILISRCLYQNWNLRF